MARLYQAAKMKSIHLHKYWVLHFLAAGFGTATMRILASLYMSVYYPDSVDVPMTPETQDAMWGYAMWLGFIVNIVVVNSLVATGLVDVSGPAKATSKVD